MQGGCLLRASHPRRTPVPRRVLLLILWSLRPPWRCRWLPSGACASDGSSHCQTFSHSSDPGSSNSLSLWRGERHASQRSAQLRPMQSPSVLQGGAQTLINADGDLSFRGDLAPHLLQEIRNKGVLAIYTPPPRQCLLPKS